MTLGAKFLVLSPDRRALAFEQAAAGQAGQSVILEKDFWVSWLLGLLFSLPHHQESRLCLCGARGEAGAWHAD